MCVVCFSIQLGGPLCKAGLLRPNIRYDCFEHQVHLRARSAGRCTSQQAIISKPWGLGLASAEFTNCYLQTTSCHY